MAVAFLPLPFRLRHSAGEILPQRKHLRLFLLVPAEKDLYLCRFCDFAIPCEQIFPIDFLQILRIAIAGNGEGRSLCRFLQNTFAGKGLLIISQTFQLSAQDFLLPLHCFFRESPLFQGTQKPLPQKGKGILRFHRL